MRVLGGTVGTLQWMWKTHPLLIQRKSPAFPGRRYAATKVLGPEHFVVGWRFQGKFSLTEDGKAVSGEETVELEEMLKLLNVSN